MNPIGSSYTQSSPFVSEFTLQPVEVAEPTAETANAVPDQTSNAKDSINFVSDPENAFTPDDLFEFYQKMEKMSDFAVIFEGKGTETPTLVELNRAYQQLKEKCEPSKYPNTKKMAEAVFQRVQCAYENLMNPLNRMQWGDDFNERYQKEYAKDLKQGVVYLARAGFEYSLAVELDDRNPLAWLKLGKVLICKQQLPVDTECVFQSKHSIIECLKKAIEIDSKLREAYILLANLLKDNEEQKEYLEFLYTEALNLLPEAQTYCDRGELYLSVGEINKAFLDFSDASKLDPELERARQGITKAEEILLVIGQKEIQCKRTALVKLEYFKKMLQGTFKEATQSKIVIQEECYDDFKEIIEYLHERKVNFTPENIFSVFKLADKYLLEPLKIECRYYLGKNMPNNNKNVLQFLEFAQLQKDNLLSEICIKGIKASSRIISFVFEAFDQNLFEAVKALINIMSTSELNTEVNSSRLLDKAISQSHIEIVTLLAEKGCEAQYSFKCSYRNGYCTPLILAAEKNDLKMMILLLERFKFIHTDSYGINTSYENKSPLHHAVIHQNLEMAELILKQHGASVETGNNPTPFHIAFTNRQKEMLELLIHYGASAESRFDYYGTYYHEAAYLGLTEILECFPKESTAWRELGRDKCPLHFAMAGGHVKTAEFLFKLDSTVIDKQQRNAMHYLALSDKSQILLPIFAEADLQNLFSHDKTRNLPIHYAMIRGDLPVTKFLIDKGALDGFMYGSGNFSNDSGQTPFDCACVQGMRDFVLKCIHYLAENRSKNNPLLINHVLHWAAMREYFEIVKYLVVEQNADVNFHLTQDSSFLHIACTKGRLEAVKFLIEHKADVNYQNSEKRTPLHEAAENGHLEVVEMLLLSGCNVSLWDNKGRTAYHLAAEKDSRHRNRDDQRKGHNVYSGIIELLSKSECIIQ